MAVWIKMPLGMELGLSPDDFMLDEDPMPSPKRGLSPLIFGPLLLWPNGWMHQDATWYGGRPLSPGDFVRWGTAPLPKKGVETPNFRPMFIVANRLDESR